VHPKVERKAALKSLSLELQFLVIDSANDLEGPEMKDKKLLMTCTLVSRTWYHHSMRRLWRSVELSYEPPPRGASLARTAERTLSLMSIVTSNERLANSIQSLILNLDVAYYNHAFDANAALFALSAFFPKVPEFHLLMPHRGAADDGTIAVATLRNLDHTLSQIIYPFLRAPVLTTLCLSGSNIRLEILHETPNLRHAQFIGVNEVSLPTVGRGFPFRLQSVKFIEADAMLSTLLEKAPNVFLDLEDLECEDIWDKEAAKLLVIPQGTLRRVSLEVVRCDNGRCTSFQIITECWSIMLIYVPH